MRLRVTHQDREMVNSHFVDSLPADSAAWPVKVFKCKHGGKGGGDKLQLRPGPQRQARPPLLRSLYSPQHGGNTEVDVEGLNSDCGPGQALDNKLDDLGARTSFQQDIRTLCSCPRTSTF